MAILPANPGGAGAAIVALSITQSGNGQSMNVADRGAGGVPTAGTALLTIVTVIGATPTCTYAIEGSVDGADWWSVAYCDAATPETLSVATFTITTATTARKILRPNHPWRYLRLTYSSNTNIMNTATLAVFAGAG